MLFPDGTDSRYSLANRNGAMLRLAQYMLHTFGGEEFVLLPKCELCSTVPADKEDSDFHETDCRKCLFGDPTGAINSEECGKCGSLLQELRPRTDGGLPWPSSRVFGHNCNTSDQQETQYEHLLWLARRNLGMEREDYEKAKERGTETEVD